MRCGRRRGHAASCRPRLDAAHDHQPSRERAVHLEVLARRGWSRPRTRRAALRPNRPRAGPRAGDPGVLGEPSTSLRLLRTRPAGGPGAASTLPEASPATHSVTPRTGTSPRRRGSAPRPVRRPTPGISLPGALGRVRRGDDGAVAMRRGSWTGTTPRPAVRSPRCPPSTPRPRPSGRSSAIRSRPSTATNTAWSWGTWTPRAARPRRCSRPDLHGRPRRWIGGREHGAGRVGGDAQGGRRAGHRQQRAVGVDRGRSATRPRRRRGWRSAGCSRPSPRPRTAWWRDR